MQRIELKECRMGDFQSLLLQGCGDREDDKEECAVLRVGDLVVITAEVTYVWGKKEKGIETVREELMLWAEGMANPTVQVLSNPKPLPNPRLHLSLFEVQHCWFPSSTTKKGEKDFQGKTAGSVILTGEDIQLRHVSSGKYVSFSLLPAICGFQITLEPRIARSTWLRVVMSPRTVQAGRPVLYDRNLVLSAKCGSVDNYLSLHARVPPYSSTPLFEVSSYTSETYFSIHRFQQHQSDLTKVSICEIVQFQHKEQGYYMSYHRGVTEDEDRLQLVKNESDAMSYWRLEPVTGLVGGVLSSKQRYFLRNVVTGGYLDAGLKLVRGAECSFQMVIGKGGTVEIVDGTDLALETDSKERVKMQTDDMHGQDVFKMIPSRKSKETDKEIHLALSHDFSEEGLFTFEIRKVSKREEDFVRKSSEILPELASFSSLFSQANEHDSLPMSVYEQLIRDRCSNSVRGVDFLSSVIITAPSKEAMQMYQNFLVGCGLHKILLGISQKIVKELDRMEASHANIGLVLSRRVKALKSIPRSPLDQAIADCASQFIPAILSLLNHIAFLNLSTSTHLSFLDKEICELFSYSKKLTANLLSEIYRLVDPPILRYEVYYEQWFDRLQTVSKENIDEQTAFVRLIRHVSETDTEVNALAQSELMKLVSDGPRQFQMIELRLDDGRPTMFFHQKGERISDEVFIEMNPDLRDKGVRGGKGELLFPLTIFESSKAMIKYGKYISEVLLLMNTICKDNGKEAVETVKTALGLSTDIILRLCKEETLSLAIRRGFIVLSTTSILANPQTDKQLKSRVSTVVLKDELETAPVVSLSEEVQLLVTWCLSFWTDDYQSEESAWESLEFLAAVIQLTAAVVEREYGGDAFLKSVTPFLEFLLMGIVSPSTSYLPAAHWTIALMAKVSEERKSFPFGINQSLKQLIEATIEQIKKNYTVLNRYKVKELLLHFAGVRMEAGDMNVQIASDSIRGIITQQIDFVNRMKVQVGSLFIPQSTASAPIKPPIKQFLCSVAFSDLHLDSDTRNSLMDLLVILINKHRMLSEDFINTQLLEDPTLVDIRKKMERLMASLHVVRSEAKFKVLLNDPECDEVQGVRDALIQLLGLLSCRMVKPDIHLCTQNMARHHSLHFLLVQLWSEVDFHLQSLSDFSKKRILPDIFRLSCDCLYYFALNNERNRLELLRLVKASFFTVYTRNAGYLIQELTDFEHVSQRSAYLCYTAVLKKCTFVPSVESLWPGLSWLRASLRRRATKKCKPDIQVIIAMSVLDHLSSVKVSLTAPSDPVSLSLVISLLAEAAEENLLVQAQCRKLVSLPVLIQCLECTTFPPLFVAWLALMAETYARPKVELTDLTVNAVIKYTEKWIDAVIASGKMGLKKVAFAGWYSQAFPKMNAELVDVHGDHLETSDSNTQWEMISSGDYWKKETGLAHSLPILLLSMDEPGQDVKAVLRKFASKIRTLLQLISDFSTANQATVDCFYLLRAVSACYAAIGLYLHGEQTIGKLTAGYSAYSLSQVPDVTVLDKIYTQEVAGEELEWTTDIVRVKTHIEELGIRFTEFAKHVVNVCNEHSFTPSHEIKSMLGLIPVFASLSQTTVTFRDRVDAIRLIKLMVRKLDTDYQSSIFETLSILLGECRDRLTAQEVFTASGAASAAVAAVVSRRDLKTMTAGIKLLCKMLGVLGAEFQNWLLGYLRESETYVGIFQLLAEELTCSVDRIAYRCQQSGTSSTLVHSERLLLPSFFTSGMSVSTLLELNFGLTHSLVQLITSCCDGCNESFQLFMSVQNRGFESSLSSIDVVSMIANYLINIAAEPKSLIGDEQARNMIEACCEALVEMVTGPCQENQGKLGKNIQLLTALVNLIEECNVHRDKREWLALFADILSFLHTLLEGSPSPQQLETMGSYLKIPSLTSAMDSIYTEYIQYREGSILLEMTDSSQSANIEIGFSIAMLVMKLRGMLPNHADLLEFGEDSWSQGLVFRHFELGVMRHIPRNSFGFYGSLIGYVEINRNGIIEGNYFKIPYLCKFLTDRTKVTLIDESMTTSQLQKQFNFLHFTKVYAVEMKHQQELYQRPIIKMMSQAWSFFGMISFGLIIAINVLLLVAGTFDTVTYVDESERKKPFNQVTVILGSLQLAFASLSFFGYLREYYPNILAHAAFQVKEEMSFQDYYSVWHNESILSSKAKGKDEETGTRTFSIYEKAVLLVLNASYLYYVVFLMASLVAIFVPYVYSVLLLDIFKRSSDLVVVVNSVTNTWKQLLNTLILNALITFLFAMVSLVFFTTYFSDGLNCGSLWECFVSSFIIGTRTDGGGLGIAMSPPSDTDSLYYPRILFDLLYYAIVILVIRNLVQGVIVDAFGDMRAQKTALDEELNQTCFICGGNRQTMERAKGWAYHFLNEHSLFAYMAFVIYVSGKDDKDCTGLEKYVKDCIKNKDCGFFPETSRYLQEHEKSP